MIYNNIKNKKWNINQQLQIKYLIVQLNWRLRRRINRKESWLIKLINLPTFKLSYIVYKVIFDKTKY